MHAARHGWELDKDAPLFMNWAIHTGIELTNIYLLRQTIVNPSIRQYLLTDLESIGLQKQNKSSHKKLFSVSARSEL